MLRSAFSGTSLILLAACGEEPPPPNGDGPRLPPPPSAEEVQAALDQLEGRDSIAARLRRDAYQSVQTGDLERPLLLIQLHDSGQIQAAERDWPGALFAGHGDYLSKFRRDLVSAVVEATGLAVEGQAFEVDGPPHRGPALQLGASGTEQGEYETPEGTVPGLTLAVSLMASFRQDPGNAERRELEFFESPPAPTFEEGVSARRILCGEPVERAHAAATTWLGTWKPAPGSTQAD